MYCIVFSLAVYVSWYVLIVVPKTVELIDDGSLGQCPQTFERIFELLSVRRIYDAVNVAMSAGMFRLGSLLCQADGDENFSVLMRQQLAVWVENQGDETIPDSLLKVYRVLAALPTTFGPLEKVYPESTLLNLGWQRAVGVFYWYGKQSIQYPVTSAFFDDQPEGEDDMQTMENPTIIEPMAAALMQYKLALNDHDADHPLAPHVTTHTHCLYNLLEILFHKENENENENNDSQNSDNDSMEKFIVSALECEGSSAHPLDYRVSFLILIFLQACNIIAPFTAMLSAGVGVSATSGSGGMDADSGSGSGNIDMDNLAAVNNNNNLSVYMPMCACIVRQHFLTQLISQGQYKWAIFVCLTIEDSFQRHYLIRQIVERYLGTAGDNEDEDINNLLNALCNMDAAAADATSTATAADANVDVNALTNSTTKNKSKSKTSTTGVEVSHLVSSKDIDYLVTEFLIPIEWMHESKAWYHGYKHQQVKQIEHFNHAHMFLYANHVLSRRIAPMTIVEMNEQKLSQLLSLLEFMNPNADITDLENYIEIPEFLSVSSSDSYLTMYNTPAAEVDSSDVAAIAVAAAGISRSQILLHFLWIQRDVKLLQSTNSSRNDKDSNYSNSNSGNSNMSVDGHHNSSDEDKGDAERVQDGNLTLQVSSLVKRCHNLLKVITRTYQEIIKENHQSRQLNSRSHPCGDKSCHSDIIYASHISKRGNALHRAKAEIEEPFTTDAYSLACYHMSAYIVEILERVIGSTDEESSGSGSGSSHTVFPLLFEAPLPSSAFVVSVSSLASSLSVRASVPVSNKIRMNAVQHECALSMDRAAAEVTGMLLESIFA